MKSKESGQAAVVARTLTQRDLAMLTWISRVRFATVDQIAARFQIDRKKGWRRLKVLVDAGLLQRTNLLQNQPGVYIATRPGLRLSGAEFPMATVSLQNFVHDRTVVDVQLQLELDGVTVITEREMRQRERLGEASFAVDVPVPHQAGAASHRPDLAMSSGRKVHAVEIELVAKSHARLESILMAYLASDRYDSVYYVVPGDHDVDRICAAGERLAMGKRLQVALLEGQEAAA